MTYRADCVTSSSVGTARPDAKALQFLYYVSLKWLYKEAQLARNHYSQGKRMRELAKKQKQEEKRERKKAKQNPQPEGPAAAPVAEA